MNISKKVAREMILLLNHLVNFLYLLGLKTLLSLFTLMKAFKKFTLPGCVSLCRVTRKIVATIGTFQKNILQGIINYLGLFSLKVYMQCSFMS